MTQDVRTIAARELAEIIREGRYAWTDADAVRVCEAYLAADQQLADVRDQLDNEHLNSRERLLMIQAIVGSAHQFDVVQDATGRDFGRCIYCGTTHSGTTGSCPGPPA